MPGMDGTGPMGQGPMTGGGFGFCNESRFAGYRCRMNPGFARGFGAGRVRGSRRGVGQGFGPGFRRGFGAGYGANYEGYYNASAEAISDKVYLENQKKFYETQLKSINEELDEYNED